MMRLFLGFFLLFHTLFAKEVSGIHLEDTLTYHAQPLQLLGAGTRNKLMFDLYAAGLYTIKPYTQAHDIINDDAPMVLRLHVISSLITSEKMEEATREGFDEVTHHTAHPFQPSIEALIGTFKEEPIVKNDIYDLFYLPKEGVIVYKNGVLKRTMGDAAFKQALFSIWLGKNPIQESLKSALLGH